MATKAKLQGDYVGQKEYHLYYPEQVLTMFDEGHILNGKINVSRYDAGAKDFLDLVDSIREIGVLEPGMLYQFRDSDKKPQVIYGTRRVLALQQANQLRLEEGQPAFPMPFEVRVRGALTPGERQAAVEIFAAENNKRVANDWLTVAEGAAYQLQLGVPVEIVLQHWPQIESEAQLRKLTRPMGILTAVEEVKEALASRKITLAQAMRVAKLPMSEQAGALTARKLPEAKRKYMNDAKRAELKRLLGDMPAAGGYMTEEFIAGIKKLSELL